MCGFIFEKSRNRTLSLFHTTVIAFNVRIIKKKTSLSENKMICFVIA